MKLWQFKNGVIYNGHVLNILKELEAESVQTVITSPPYWGLRLYDGDPQIWPDGWIGHLGFEETPELYIQHLVIIFNEIKRILREDGTLWLNIGDSYMAEGAWGGCYTKGLNKTDNGFKHRELRHKQLLESKKQGYKPKNLIGIPWRVALELQKNGWFIRSDIIWNKTNPMPEPVKDRPSKSHEYIFLFSKNGKRNGYYYNKDNERTVWNIPIKSITDHSAVFPYELVEKCVNIGSEENSLILDPFFGSGTVGVVCEDHNRKWIGIELSKKYCDIAKKEIQKTSGFITTFLKGEI